MRPSPHTLLLALGLLGLSACTSTPTPTGDRLVSISWVNQNPTPYGRVETTVCGSDRPVTLEGLPAYSEQALRVDLDLMRSCTVSVRPVIGQTPLPKQSAPLASPNATSPDRRYHLRIQVFPNAPPSLRLEPADRAHQRLKEAGRALAEL